MTMDDFKLNAEKMIAAQRAKDRRAQSPETESNWDSSDLEDNTVTQVSSEEEFSVRSTRSHKSTRSNKSSKSATRLENAKMKTSSKPDAADTRRRIAKPNNEGVSASKGPARSGVNVFVDRGQYDSEEESQRSAAARTKKKAKREEVPPYDFRNAINDENNDAPSEKSNQRPGRVRKGHSYDPAPPRPRPAQQSQKGEGAGSWDESDENERAPAQILQERDSVQTNNNKSLTAGRDGGDVQQEDSTKIKGWLIRPKGKAKQQLLEEPRRDTDVAVATPPAPLLRHTDVGVEEKQDEAEVICSRESYGTTRYIYIYHHGNTSYHDTRSSQEEVYMTGIADKSERAARRCAREIFATLRIVVDFLLIFLLETLRFVAYNVVGALLVGVTVGFGDYFLKPFATALFNGVCQPLAMLLFNVGVVTRTSTRPFIDVLHNFLAEIALVIRSFRLVELDWSGRHRHQIEDV